MRKSLILLGSVVALSFSPMLASADVVVSVEPEVQTWVMEQPGPVVTYDRDVVVGDVLPEEVEIVEVPKYTQYRYVILNNRRVIVDSGTRRVVAVYP